jgi:hypothetical protein
MLSRGEIALGESPITRRRAMSSKRSRVHPTYKTKYRVTNWPKYDRGLVDRGDLTHWISQEAIDAWHPERSGARGGQRRYSDARGPDRGGPRLVFPEVMGSQDNFGRVRREPTVKQLPD